MRFYTLSVLLAFSTVQAATITGPSNQSVQVTRSLTSMHLAFTVNKCQWDEQVLSTGSGPTSDEAYVTVCLQCYAPITYIVASLRSEIRHMRRTFTFDAIALCGHIAHFANSGGFYA